MAGFGVPRGKIVLRGELVGVGRRNLTALQFESQVAATHGSAHDCLHGALLIPSHYNLLCAILIQAYTTRTHAYAYALADQEVFVGGDVWHSDSSSC